MGWGSFKKKLKKAVKSAGKAVQHAIDESGLHSAAKSLESLAGRVVEEVGEATGLDTLGHAVQDASRIIERPVAQLRDETIQASADFLRKNEAGLYLWGGRVAASYFSAICPLTFGVGCVFAAAVGSVGNVGYQRAKGQNAAERLERIAAKLPDEPATSSSSSSSSTDPRMVAVIAAGGLGLAALAAAAVIVSRRR